MVLAAGLLAGAGWGRPLVAQAGMPEMPPMPVYFTPAISAEVRSSVELTGTVKSRRASLVASEVDGVVVELAARQGDHVERGAPLVRLRSTNPRLRLEAARLELAKTARDRAHRLFEERVISQEQLDERLSEFEASEGRVERLEAEVALLEDELGRTTVRAPFSGVVVAERVAVGEWLAAGGPVVELVDTGSLEIELEVPESLFARLSPGSRVRVRLDALGELEVEGEIRAVVPSANPQARTFPVLVRIDNAGGRIGVGMLARASLPVGKSRQGVMVPKDALVAQGGNYVLYVLGEGDAVRPVSVATGSAEGDWIAVTGIEPAARVVTVGNERLRPGQAVAPQIKEYPLP